jgi:hypothetical protein
MWKLCRVGGIDDIVSGNNKKHSSAFTTASWKLCRVVILLSYIEAVVNAEAVFFVVA